MRLTMMTSCDAGTALRALRAAAGVGSVPRGALLLCSKAGYLPPALAAPGALPDAAVAESVDGHCMHPAALAASLRRSLANLGVATLDVLYVHNAAEAQSEAIGKAEFARRLRDAFGALEAERASGRIVAYGLATWHSLRVPAHHPAFLDLQAAVDAAQDAAGGPHHGLRFVQLPCGAAMPEAFTLRNQLVRRPGAPRGEARSPHALTPLPAAAALGLTVVASGPLAEGAALRGDGALADALARPPRGVALAALSPGNDAAKLLQLARSVPGVTTALVGHKQPRHVAQNVQLSAVPPLPLADFAAAAAWLLPHVAHQL
jgi:aryl-alcohol dehydrogenase-like predicted oxidoreductase